MSPLPGNQNSDHVNDMTRLELMSNLARKSYAVEGIMMNIQLKPDQVFFNENQVAGILQVSARTVRNYRKDGRLKYFQPSKKVYISMSDLMEFITGNANAHDKGQV